MTAIPTGAEYSAQRNTLVAVSGLPGYWANKSGGDTEGDTSDVYDGGQLRPAKLGGAPTTSNVTLQRPYKPARDQAVRRDLTPLVNSWRTTLSEQDTDANLQPIGKPFTYPDALLVAVRAPETDASSGDPKIIELEFAVSNIV